MSEKIGPTRQQRRMGTKGKDARRRARDAYKATHGRPGQQYKHLPANYLAIEARDHSLRESYAAENRDYLRKLAAEYKIDGRGSMTKDQLVEALVAYRPPLNHADG